VARHVPLRHPLRHPLRQHLPGSPRVVRRRKSENSDIARQLVSLLVHYSRLDHRLFERATR